MRTIRIFISYFLILVVGLCALSGGPKARPLHHIVDHVLDIQDSHHLTQPMGKHISKDHLRRRFIDRKSPLLRDSEISHAQFDDVAAVAIEYMDVKSFYISMSEAPDPRPPSNIFC